MVQVVKILFQFQSQFLSVLFWLISIEFGKSHLHLVLVLNFNFYKINCIFSIKIDFFLIFMNSNVNFHKNDDCLSTHLFYPLFRFKIHISILSICLLRFIPHKSLNRSISNCCPFIKITIFLFFSLNITKTRRKRTKMANMLIWIKVTKK